MNREQVKKFLPVMQAFAEGKTIQYSNGSCPWVDTPNPTWCTTGEYRVKPEPKILYAIQHKNNGTVLMAGASKEAITGYFKSWCNINEPSQYAVEEYIQVI